MTYDSSTNEGDLNGKERNKRKQKPIVVSVSAHGSGGYAAPRTKGASLADNINADSKVQSNEEEVGGPKGLEPTRFGDWEKKGKCIDF